MKRTYIINITKNPSISGYAGWDEWTLKDLTPEQADYFLERLDKLVKSCVKNMKLEDSGFTGSN